MEKLILNSKKLKQIVFENRKNITNINGVQFGEMYPMLTVTNSNASYYSVEAQESKSLVAPFKITFKNA